MAQHQNFFKKSHWLGAVIVFVAKIRNFGRKKKEKTVPSKVIKGVFEKIFKKVATFGGKQFRNCQGF
jgi:hypothetical protein